MFLIRPRPFLVYYIFRFLRIACLEIVRLVR
jgi:hypothetical protein